jgi:hypothetical protein
MSRTLLLLFSLTLLLFIIFMSISYSLNPQLSLPVIKTLSIHPTLVPEMALMLEPEKTDVNPGSYNHLDVVVNTKSSIASIIQLEIAYDPEAITDVSVLPGTYFMSANVLLNTIDKKNGRISYAIAPSNNQKPNTNAHTVAIINFRANLVNNIQTKFTFLPKTAIQYNGAKISLHNVRGTIITIASGSARSLSPTAAFYIPIFNKK